MGGLKIQPVYLFSNRWLLITLWKHGIQSSLSSVAITACDAVQSVYFLSSFGGHLAIKFTHTLLNIHVITLVS